MRLLVLGALIGAPIAFVAYFYLRFVGQAQTYVFSTLPHELGFSKAPAWWPIAPLLVGGLIVALAVTYLPGTGGHKPAEGFHTGGGNEPINLPGIVVCSLATLCLGAVLGPEAPLIAIGGGLGVLAIHLVNKDAPPMAAVVIGGAGSFAAIATLFGSPLAAAFLLMEAVGVGGPAAGRPSRSRSAGRRHRSPHLRRPRFVDRVRDLQPERLAHPVVRLTRRPASSSGPSPSASPPP